MKLPIHKSKKANKSEWNEAVKSSSILIAVVLMVGTILAIFGHYYSKRQADWVEVQKAANTVDSGLRNEPLIALRPKVANLNAALTHYIDGGGGRRNEKRVLSIQQAIESLKWAIDHETSTSTVLDGTEDFSFFEKRPYLVAEPDCAESVGRLFLNSTVITRACLTYTEYALTKPNQSPKLRTVDLNTLRGQCRVRTP